MRADLLDAQAAIDWAVEQIPMLKKRIGDWADSYSTRIAIEDGKKAYYLRANPVPAIINAETGSIINSIRTSLDLLASALAARNGNAGSRQVYFPVCGTQAQFLKDGKGKIKLLSPADQAASRPCSRTTLEMGYCRRCMSWTSCESIANSWRYNHSRGASASSQRTGVSCTTITILHGERFRRRHPCSLD